MPLGVKILLYLNPFFYLTVSFSRIQNLYPERVGRNAQSDAAIRGIVSPESWFDRGSRHWL
jgi:hypothetical protein